MGSLISYFMCKKFDELYRKIKARDDYIDELERRLCGRCTVDQWAEILKLRRSVYDNKKKDET